MREVLHPAFSWSGLFCWAVVRHSEGLAISRLVWHGSIASQVKVLVQEMGSHVRPNTSLGANKMKPV